MNKLLPGVAGGSVNYSWSSVGVLIGNALQIALTVAGGVAAIYLLIGAIQYFTAYGDEAKAGAAKKTIFYTIIGIVIIVIAKIVINWVWGFVTIEPLNFLI